MPDLESPVRLRWAVENKDRYAELGWRPQSLVLPILLPYIPEKPEPYRKYTPPSPPIGNLEGITLASFDEPEDIPARPKWKQLRLPFSAAA